LIELTEDSQTLYIMSLKKYYSAQRKSFLHVLYVYYWCYVPKRGYWLL